MVARMCRVALALNAAGHGDPRVRQMAVVRNDPLRVVRLVRLATLARALVRLRPVVVRNGRYAAPGRCE
jgi:uncharacterized protein (DUF2236 family)